MHVCKRGLMCPNCLSESERATLRGTLASDKSALLQEVKHMRERHIPIPECTALWLFYLPDFTTIFKDWYGRYVGEVIDCYGVEAEASLHRDATYLLLVYRGERPCVGLRRRFIEDVQALSHLAESSFRAEAEYLRESRILDGYMGKKELPQNFSSWLSSLTKFAAFGLDTVFPEEMLCELVPGISLSDTYFSRISSWKTLSDGMIDTLESVYVGKMTEEEAIVRYADTYCHLRWSDIESREDDLRFAHEMFASLRTLYPGSKAIDTFRREGYDKRRMLGSPCMHHGVYVEKVLESTAVEYREKVAALLDFASVAQEYNERRRIHFTSGLSRIRSICENYVLDWRSVSLEEVLKTVEGR